MRGKVAKIIRKLVYKDQSLRAIRKYSHSIRGIVNIGLRQEYLDAKRDYVSDARGSARRGD